MLHVIFLLSLFTLSDCLDESVFRAKLDGTGLSEEKIEELVSLYNQGRPINASRKFVKTIDDEAVRKKVKAVLERLSSEDKFLSQLYHKSIKAVKPIVNETIIAKAEKLHNADDSKYKGDFAKIQLDVVRYIKNAVPSDLRANVTAAMDSPLARLQSENGRKRLEKAIRYFQNNQTVV